MDSRLDHLIAEWAYFKMDYQRAESLFDRILNKNPESIIALNGKALIAMDHRKNDIALMFLKKALQYDSLSVFTLQNYANALLKSGDSKTYIFIIDNILLLDSLNSDALYGKGHYLCRYKYDMKNGIKYLNKALEINPYNQKAHNFLGRGYSPVNYDFEICKSRQQKEVDSLLQNNRFQQAYSIIVREYQKDSDNIETLKLLAATEFHLENYKNCIKLSFKILNLKQNFGLAHYFISESITRLKEKYNVLIPEFKIEFVNKHVPDSIPFLDKVFINYNKCDLVLQKNIRSNAAYFKGFMEVIYVSGATVYFKDFHHFLWNCPYLENTKGTKTADLRLVDDIGGQGGYHTSSEKLLQSYAINGGYNIAFHEFAHLVHWLLTPNEISQIRRMFIKAKKENYTLDWYASMNEREYFAQGVEARLSENKLPRQSAEYSNTKADLLRRDKDLYHFIEKLVSKKSYRDNIIQAYILKSQYAGTNAEAIQILNNGLSKFPDNPNLLIELGNVFRYDGDLDRAIATHRKVLENNNSDIDAAIALSYDLYVRNKTVEESINILKFLYNKNTESSDLCTFLGFCHVLNQNFDLAVEPLQKSIELNPFPDPYTQTLEDAYHLLAKCHIEKAEFTLAESNLIQSLAINGSNMEANIDLAYVKFKLNKTVEAKRFIEIAYQLDPRNKRTLEIKKLLQ